MDAVPSQPSPPTELDRPAHAGRYFYSGGEPLLNSHCVGECEPDFLGRHGNLDDELVFAGIHYFCSMRAEVAPSSSCRVIIG